MSKRCTICDRLNVERSTECTSCGGRLRPIDEPKHGSIKRRAIICLLVSVGVLASFYLSLVFSAKPLTGEQFVIASDAIDHVEASGFGREAFLLRNVTTFRSTDNWLNSSVAKENAYAATNFPFAIITLYSDFFTYPSDEVERAAILLHEVKHVQGMDEHEAYEFVWRNRRHLGWTRDKYLESPVWENIRKQTKDNVPELFTCIEFEASDCTETKLQRAISVSIPKP
ncbi:MAG TPA: hypothetical protein PKA82_09335 [Pyrinomonadaceae bacterium]|nr:hypothetical protein [Pyrinomonadaceae bacterium]